MRVGDSVSVIVTARNTSGAAVDGLAGGTFAVAAYLDGAATSLSFTVTGIGGGTGRYRVALTLPVVTGFLQLFITQAANTIEDGKWAGEVEVQDLDSLHALVVAPAVTATSGARIGAVKDLEVNARRRTAVTLSITDQAGAAVNLTGYSNLRFTAWDATHTGGTPFTTVTTGFTANAGGTLSWTIPEDAGLNAAMDAAITAGQDTANLFYDVIGDNGGAANTETIVRGRLTLTRWEGAA